MVFYGKGISNGLKVIFDVSIQFDFYYYQLFEVWVMKVYMIEIFFEWKEINDYFCVQGLEYIDFLENGGMLLVDFFF